MSSIDTQLKELTDKICPTGINFIQLRADIKVLFIKWLKQKYEEEQAMQFYGPYSCDVCTAPANTIEKLLEELTCNESQKKVETK